MNTINKARISLTSLAAAMLMLASANAAAVAVAPGTTVSLPGTTAAAEPFLAGTVLEDQLTPFSFAVSSGGLLTGTVQERVVQEDGTGFLDFYWRIYGISGSDNLGAFRLANFVYDTFDANYRIDGSGSIAPSGAMRFSGSQQYNINFLFQDSNGAATLGSGDGSRFFFLHTTATQYAETASFDLATNHSGISGQYVTFAPAVPEPETYAMMMAGLGMVGFMARRRKA